MALNAGLFKTQDQNEQDLTDGPGWTIDEQKPSFFSGFGVTPVLRGIGQGAADGISLLTHGLHEVTQGLPLPNPVTLMGSPIQAALDIASTKPTPSALEDASAATRNYSKTLIADPRITGTAANLVQGFSHVVTEFGVGSLAGGPETGAALLGASEGYAHYHDLLDQGVDAATAEKSALLTGLTSAGGALLPMGMPAKLLGGLSTAGTVLAQAGAGAAINTAFGAASRYGSAKILNDAGYHEMAEQTKPWDETNVITDALSGLFFGAHAAWHGLKASDVDPSIRDAAKAVQDRQAVIDRAPGVPVDMASAAVHRQALETALGDLMTDKPVDLSTVNLEGATFARRPVEEGSAEAAAVMRDAFVKSGVLDDAEDFDRWLAGEHDEMAPTTPKGERKSQSAAESAQSVKTEPAAEAGGYDVGEQEEMSDEQLKQFQGLRSELRADEDVPGSGERASGESGHPDDGRSRASAARSGEPLTVYRGARRDLSPADFEETALGHSTGHPTSGLGVYFTNQRADAARYGTVSAHHLDIQNPKRIPIEEMPQFNSVDEATAYRNELKAQGHDGLTIDASHLGGPVQHVAFEHSQVIPAGAAKPKAPVSPLADRPDLKIVDENGTPRSAADAHTEALADEAQANKEADPLFQAAVTCEARHQ